MIQIQVKHNRFFRFPLLVVLLVALFGLAACGGGDQEAAGSTGSTGNAASAGGAAAGPLKFLYLFAADCEPCKNMDPVITELTTDYKGKIAVERYDTATDQGKKLLSDYGFKKTPSYVILAADGSKLWANAGEIHKDLLHQELDTLLQK